MESLRVPSLPDDLIIAIAAEVKRQSPSNGSLWALSLVNKRFHTLTSRILYRNIFLNHGTLSRFLQSFDQPKCRHYIRSLTLYIERLEQSGIPLRIANPTKGKETINQIARLTPLIEGFNNMASFSLTVDKDNLFGLPPPTLIALINALPESCTNMELDINTVDWSHSRPSESYEHDEGQVHVCASIRRVLPRMRNVRLRLNPMCSAMFGARYPTIQPFKSDDTNEEKSEMVFEPISLPKIKSLVVSCGYANDWEWYGPKECTKTTTASVSVSSGLEKVVSKHAEVLKDSVIRLCIATGIDEPSPFSTLEFCTQLRVDLLIKECWALPFYGIDDPYASPFKYTMHEADGSHLVFVLIDDIDSVTEGQMWKTIVGGGRLPNEVIDAEKRGHPSFATGCVELSIQLMTIDQWNSEFSSNESRLEPQDVQPERRIGAHYLDESPILHDFPR